MANLDNTVLAAVLLALSGHTTQAGLWFEMRFGKPELDAKEDRFFRGLTPNRTRHPPPLLVAPAGTRHPQGLRGPDQDIFPVLRGQGAL